MKKIFLLLASLLALPALAFAAFDDVTLTTDTVITVGGINLTISSDSSSVVESITVDTSEFSFILRSGSSIQVTSSDRRQMTTNAPVQYIATNECSGSASVLKFSSSDSNSTSISVTPQSATCGNNATSAVVPSTSSSSSGGGGGVAPAGLVNPTPPSTVVQNAAIAVTKVAPTVPIAQVVAPPVATPAPTAFSSSKALRSGTTGTDVKLLQRLLNKVGIIVATTGDGSPGNETDRFGKLTEKAVQKFQAKYGIVSSGTPDTTGYGLVGAKTRAKLLDVASAVPTVEPSVPVSTPIPTAGVVSAVFTRALSIGANSADVKRLQQLLNSDPDTRVAESGPGSIGNESAYFGSLTTKAIQKFQVKYNVAKPGEAGYGSLGPKTRAKLQEIFGR